MPRGAIAQSACKNLPHDPAAQATFDKLSYSNKRRSILSIEDAKSPETRQRRIVSTITTLRDG